MVKIGDVVGMAKSVSSEGYIVRGILSDGKAMIELISNSHLKLQMMVEVGELVVLF